MSAVGKLAKKKKDKIKKEKDSPRPALSCHVSPCSDGRGAQGMRLGVCLSAAIDNGSKGDTRHDRLTFMLLFSFQSPRNRSADPLFALTPRIHQQARPLRPTASPPIPREALILGILLACFALRVDSARTSRWMTGIPSPRRLLLANTEFDVLVTTTANQSVVSNGTCVALPLSGDSVPKLELDLANASPRPCSNHTDCCKASPPNLAGMSLSSDCVWFCQHDSRSSDERGTCSRRWRGLCFSDGGCPRGFLCSKKSALDTAGTCVHDAACARIRCLHGGTCRAGHCMCPYPFYGVTCEAGSERRAYVTLLFDGSGPDTVMMARVWARTLRRAGAREQDDIVALVTRGVAHAITRVLHGDGIRVISVDAIGLPKSLQSNEARRRWHSVFTKLRAWELVEYDRVAYMDMDVLVTTPGWESPGIPGTDGDFDDTVGIDDIFSSCEYDLCIARDPVHNPGSPMGNVGVLILRPSRARFSHMIASVRRVRSRFVFPEQEWLTRYFLDPKNKLRAGLLPHIYNTCSLDEYVYGGPYTEHRDAFDPWGWRWPRIPGNPAKSARYPRPRARVFHFCGKNKPPHFRPPDDRESPVVTGDEVAAIMASSDVLTTHIRMWHRAYADIDSCVLESSQTTCESVQGCAWVVRGGDKAEKITKNNGLCFDAAIARVFGISGASKNNRVFSLDMPRRAPAPAPAPRAEAHPTVVAAATRRAWPALGVPKKYYPDREGPAPFVERVLYQIVTDRFARAAGIGREPRGSPNAPDLCGRDLTRSCGGNWAGITRNLDHLIDMGVGALWMSPFHEATPGCYHGYCPRSLTNPGIRVNPGFGGLEQLYPLLSALREWDVAVMGDIVVNHLGEKLEDLNTPNEANVTVSPLNPGIHFHPPGIPGWCRPDMTPLEMEQCWLFGAPDLNHSHPEVAQLVLKFASETVTEFGLDAIRIDAARHVTPEFLLKLSEALPVPAFAEVLHGDVALVGGFQKLVPGIFNFPFHFVLVDQFAKKQEFVGDAVEQLGLSRALADAWTETKSTFRAPEKLINFIENHDTPRFLSRSGADKALYLNVMALVLAWPGIPGLYYGGEFGLGQQAQNEGAEGSGDDEKKLDEDGFEKYLPDRHRQKLWEEVQNNLGPRGRGTIYSAVRAMIAAREATGWASAAFEIETTSNPRDTAAFTRGSALVVVSNSGTGIPGGSPDETVTVTHRYPPHTRLCNVLPPYGCMIVQSRAAGVAAADQKNPGIRRGSPIRHQFHGSMPAIYVPLPAHAARVVLPLMAATPRSIFATDARRDAERKIISHHIFDSRAHGLRRPRPRCAAAECPKNVLGLFHPLSSNETANVEAEPDVVLRARDAALVIGVTSTQPLLIFEAEFEADDSETVNLEPQQAVCLFRSSVRECIGAVRAARTERSWATTAGRHVETGRVIAVLHWLSVDNFYHFIVETLPYALHELMQSCRSEKINASEKINECLEDTMLALPTPGPLRFVTRTLALLGIGPDKLIHLNSRDSKVVLARHVTVLGGVAAHRRPTVFPSAHIIQNARSWAAKILGIPGVPGIPGFKSGSRGPRVVWVRRRNTNERVVRGGDDVLVDAIRRVAEKDGGSLTIVDPGGKTSAQGTLTAMVEADVVVGVHGAGLANFIFARRGTTLVEILPLLPGIPVVNYHYWTLATAIEAEYWVVPVTVSETEVTEKNGFGGKMSAVGEFDVPVDAFVRTLRAALEGRPKN